MNGWLMVGCADGWRLDELDLLDARGGEWEQPYDEPVCLVKVKG